VKKRCFLILHGSVLTHGEVRHFGTWSAQFSTC